MLTMPRLVMKTNNSKYSLVFYPAVAIEGSLSFRVLNKLSITNPGQRVTVSMNEFLKLSLISFDCSQKIPLKIKSELIES